tara:strand:+ start:687 stop:1340 length:654 start_codon:yes stop_codon:yes gene_type:complete
METSLMNWTNRGNLINYFFTNIRGTYYEGLEVDLPVFKKTLEEIINSNKGDLKLIIETVLDDNRWLDEMIENIEIDLLDEEFFNGLYMIDNHVEWLDDSPFNDNYPVFHIYKYKIHNNYKPSVDIMDYFQPTLEDILRELPDDKEIVIERDFWINIVTDYYDKKVYEKVRKNFSDIETIKSLIKLKPKGEPIMLFNWNWESPNDNSCIEMSTSLCSV